MLATYISAPTQRDLERTGELPSQDVPLAGLERRIARPARDADLEGGGELARARQPVTPGCPMHPVGELLERGECRRRGRRRAERRGVLSN